MGQSASFTPRTLTLGAMSTGVKQYNAGPDRSMIVACCGARWVGQNSARRGGMRRYRKQSDLWFQCSWGKRLCQNAGGLGIESIEAFDRGLGLGVLVRVGSLVG